MKAENEPLPKNKNNDNKPIQEAMPSGQQKPMGDEDDLIKNAGYLKKDDSDDTNSVGIKKD